MSVSISSLATALSTSDNTPVRCRRIASDSDPAILSAIYEEEVNIATWHRTLPKAFQGSIAELLDQAPTLELILTTTPESAHANVRAALPKKFGGSLAEDIAELVGMFCFLFDLKRAGLRLVILHEAMCPRFHVDMIPCRLVTTYTGRGTEWLRHESVDRGKLGAKGQGLSDDQTGVYEHRDDILELNCGDVALLKGETWDGNENGGLVHRSPCLTGGDRRLLLTLDFGG